MWFDQIDLHLWEGEYDFIPVLLTVQYKIQLQQLYFTDLYFCLILLVLIHSQ